MRSSVAFALAVALSTLSLAGLRTAPPAQACGTSGDTGTLCANEQQYVDDLAKIDINLKSGSTPGKLLDTGDAICRGLKADAHNSPLPSAVGGIKNDVASSVRRGVPTLSFEQAEGWVQAAIDNLCPSWHDDVAETPNGGSQFDFSQLPSTVGCTSQQDGQSPPPGQTLTTVTYSSHGQSVLGMRISFAAAFMPAVTAGIGGYSFSIKVKNHGVTFALISENDLGGWYINPVVDDANAVFGPVIGSDDRTYVRRPAGDQLDVSLDLARFPLHDASVIPTIELDSSYVGPPPELAFTQFADQSC